MKVIWKTALPVFLKVTFHPKKVASKGYIGVFMGVLNTNTVR